MDERAIQQIQETAVAAARLLDDAKQAPGLDRPIVALPSSLTVHDLEKFMFGRARFRGTFSTGNPDAFAEYIKAQAPGAVCFVNGDSMVANAIFDLGTVEDPKHAEHRAVLTMEKTAPFRALLARNGETHTQRLTAEWIEDWRDFIHPCNADGEDIPLVKAVSAVRSLSLEEKRAHGFEEQDFKSKRTAMEEIEAKGAHENLPVFLDFRCTPYEGLSKRSFRARLGIVSTRGESAPSFVLRIVREEHELEQVALEFRKLLDGKFSGLEVRSYFGSFKA